MTFAQLESAIKHADNVFDDFIEKYKTSDKKIFLFGAGLCGRSYVNIFSRKNIPFEGIIDNYKTSLDGYPTIRFETVLEKFAIKDCIIVLSAPGSEQQILKQVLEVFPREQVYTFAITRYGIGEENEADATKQFFVQNRSFLLDLYNHLGDDFSRKVFCHVFLGRVAADKNIFSQVQTGDFYYPPEIIRWKENEVLVELGANNGDTLKDFIARCPGFKKVYCFEPDSACLSALNMISNLYPNRINIIPKIAWNKECKLSFYNNNGDGSSAVTENTMEGHASLPASSVDIEVKDQVTFMKMDIEGAELKALQGAERTIKSFKPKLAISVYHKRNDLVDIPQYLQSIHSDYKFFLRHHGVDDTDTVLYAI